MIIRTNIWQDIEDFKMDFYSLARYRDDREDQYIDEFEMRDDIHLLRYDAEGITEAAMYYNNLGAIGADKEFNLFANIVGADTYMPIDVDFFESYPVDLKDIIVFGIMYELTDILSYMLEWNPTREEIQIFVNAMSAMPTVLCSDIIRYVVKKESDVLEEYDAYAADELVNSFLEGLMSIYLFEGHKLLYLQILKGVQRCSKILFNRMSKYYTTT